MNDGDIPDRPLQPIVDDELAEPRRELGGNAMWHFRRFRLGSSSPAKVALVVGLILLCTSVSTYTVKSVSLRADGPAPEEETSAEGPAAERRVLQLQYFNFHPFNLLYLMTVQTLFGIPGETAAKLPMLYSKYELEVILRTLSSTSRIAHPAPHNSTGLVGFVAEEPSEAYMYLAALMTTPRATVLHAWLYASDSVYKLVQEAEVDVLDALDKVSTGTARGFLGVPLQFVRGLISGRKEHNGPGTTSDASVKPSGRRAARTLNWRVKLGAWLWPVVFFCPGLFTCFVALAAGPAFPVAASWVLVTGVLRMGCELLVLVHCATLVWRRRPQAAVQCLACSHGVPFMLGCHALLLLRLAMALLPARAFFVVSFCLYAWWAPIADLSIMVFALQPHAGAPIQGAVDNIIHHLGHRAGADLHPHGAGEAVHEGPSITLRFRKHWPPPVKVPAELQENSESAPRHVLCPITHHILTEPAVTSTGATYERSAILEWVSKAGKDPLTGHNITVDEVFPNLVMYSVVEEYVRDASVRPAAEPELSKPESSS